MKTKSLIFTIALLLTAVIQGFGQSCCMAPGTGGATTAFASLSNDPAFVRSHLAPLPFVLKDQTGQTVTFNTPDGKTGQGYEIKAAKPSNKYLFVIHEWWGLNDYVKLECENFKKELPDVNILAIDMYDGKFATTADSAGALMGRLKQDRAVAIINGAIGHAGPNAKVATIGWCFGGGWSLQSTLLLGKQAAGCVMYYGMPEADATKIATLQADVLGLFAKQDKWITPVLVDKFAEQAKAAGKHVEVHQFDADHAFANPSNPHHDVKASAEAHKLALDFLKKHLNS